MFRISEIKFVIVVKRLNYLLFLILILLLPIKDAKPPIPEPYAMLIKIARANSLSKKLFPSDSDIAFAIGTSIAAVEVLFKIIEQKKLKIKNPPNIKNGIPLEIHKTSNEIRLCNSHSSIAFKFKKLFYISQ
jgi:hypothetical protein